VSADVISIEAWQAQEARRRDFATATQADGPTLAVECAAAAIAHEVGRLDLHQRIAIERALWRLVDDAEWHRRRDPWD
jgi:hypothetical protein